MSPPPCYCRSTGTRSWVSISFEAIHLPSVYWLTGSHICLMLLYPHLKLVPGFWSCFCSSNMWWSILKYLWKVSLKIRREKIKYVYITLLSNRHSHAQFEKLPKFLRPNPIFLLYNIFFAIIFIIVPYLLFKSVSSNFSFLFISPLWEFTN